MAPSRAAQRESLARLAPLLDQNRMGTTPGTNPEQGMSQFERRPPPLTCPSCRLAVPRQTVKFGRVFRCSQCAELLQVSRGQAKIGGFISIAIGALFCYWLGIRGWGLVMASTLAFVPAVFLVAFVNLLLFPPVLEIVREDGWRPLGETSDPRE